jgi:hypothetical protein
MIDGKQERAWRARECGALSHKRKDPALQGKCGSDEVMTGADDAMCHALHIDAIVATRSEVTVILG